MINWLEPLVPILEDLESRQAAPEASSAPLAPPGMVRCGCNKKFMALSEIKRHQSKLVGQVSDSLCDECFRQIRTHALIACIRCKAVVARLAPGRTKSGFVFRPGEVYHTNGCPNKGCMPDVVSTFLIEKSVFDLHTGTPVKPEIAAALRRGKI